MARLGAPSGVKGPHAVRWQAFTEAALVLLRSGESDSALVRQVLDAQDQVWDEQDREAKRQRKRVTTGPTW